MMWLDPPDILILNDNEVHIWRADLDVEERFIKSFFNLLSPDEKTRAQKFRFEKDRRNFIAARGTLRSLIGKYLGVDPAVIAFQYSEFGKPFIVDNHSLQFNISHAQNMALFAFARGFNIGVDIELLNPDIEVEDIANSFFSENEIMNLLALPRHQQTLGFFNCWTRKEAFIKAVGEGLSFPLDKFEVSLEPEKPAKLLATHWNPDAVTKWSIYSIAPKDNFIGSVVIEGSPETLKFWNWQMS